MLQPLTNIFITKDAEATSAIYHRQPGQSGGQGNANKEHGQENQGGTGQIKGWQRNVDNSAAQEPPGTAGKLGTEMDTGQRRCTHQS